MVSCFRCLLKFAVLGFLLIPSLSVHAQLPSGTAQAAEFTPPFEAGDILVYWIDPDYVPYLKHFIISTSERGRYWGDKETWFNGWRYYPFIKSGEECYHHRFSTDSLGYVLHEGESLRSEFHLYPAFIPVNQQVELNDETWDVVRIMDTVILNTATRAFVLERDGLQRIITERFGETAMRMTDGEMKLSLSSAVIRDTSYNRDTTQRIYMPLCIGNRYVYHRYFDDVLIEETLTEVVGDTIIEGDTYYHLVGNGPLVGWFRCDPEGLYRRETSTTQLVIQGDASLGSRTTNGMISDTGSVSPFPNQERSYYYASDGYYIPHYVNNRIWLAGLGLQSQRIWDYAIGEDKYTFIWGVICGEEYGVIVSAEDDAILPASTSITSIHPHPLREHGTVSFSLPQPDHIRLTVHDLLGRRILTLSDSHMPAGSHQAVIDASSLRPGIYFCILRTSVTQSVRRFVVAP